MLNFLRADQNRVVDPDDHDVEIDAADGFRYKNGVAIGRWHTTISGARINQSRIANLYALHALRIRIQERGLARFEKEWYDITSTMRAAKRFSGIMKYKDGTKGLAYFNIEEGIAWSSVKPDNAKYPLMQALADDWFRIDAIHQRGNRWLSLVDAVIDSVVNRRFRPLLKGHSTNQIELVFLDQRYIYSKEYSRYGGTQWVRIASPKSATVINIKD